jgi:hypothetical protein
MVRRPSPALIVACVALAVSLSGAAIAAIPARDGDVHACYDPSTGVIKLVDTKSDRFSCPRKWRGLVWDTRPTQLVSPNGDYRVSVRNDGITLSGPGGGIELTPADLRVHGDVHAEVRAGARLDLRGAQVRINDGSSSQPSNP